MYVFMIIAAFICFLDATGFALNKYLINLIYTSRAEIAEEKIELPSGESVDMGRVAQEVSEKILGDENAKVQ